MLARMSSGLKDNFKGDSYEKNYWNFGGCPLLNSVRTSPNNNYYTGNNNCDDCSAIDNSHTQYHKRWTGSPFTLTFKEGDNLLDVMKAQLKIVEKDGFISSINGVEQVPAENKYWLFDVNGTMSPVGAKEVILKAGDVIDWKLNKLQ